MKATLFCAISLLTATIINLNANSVETLEQKAYREAHDAFLLCEEFAAFHELPVEYIWMEFVDPSVADLETVTRALYFAP